MSLGVGSRCLRRAPPAPKDGNPPSRPDRWSVRRLQGVTQRIVGTAHGAGLALLPQLR